MRRLNFESIRIRCGMLLAMGLLVFASCSEDVEENAGNKAVAGDVTISLNLALGTDSSTRAVKTGDDGTGLIAYWADGEEVTVGITHDNTTTYQNVTVNSISSDRLRAYVSLTVDGSNVTTGDKITVIYPSQTLSDDKTSYSGEINYTMQNGSAGNLKDFDMWKGESTLTVNGSSATLAKDMELSSSLTSYIGVTCLDDEGNEINVKQMTVRPVADDTGAPAWTNWKTKVTIDADGIETEYWGGIIATRNVGSTDRLYIAMPVVNSGQKMVFTAITDDDKVYAVTKTWTGTADEYYPAKLTMESVPIPTAVDLGLSHKWASRDVGAPNDVDAVGIAYAYGEITERNGHNVKYADQSLPDSYADGWPWIYDFQHTPYQTNPNATSYSRTTWSKYSTGYSELESCDDAASMMYGTNWKTPDINDLEEIYNDIVDEKLTQDVQYGGIIITSQIEGHEGESITFLNTQYRYNSTLYGRNSSNLTLYRWISTTSSYTGTSWVLRLNHNSVGSIRVPAGLSYATYYRCVGCPIRPVYIK